MTPDRIKAFLDDLARLSIKHGLWIDPVEGARVDEIEPEQGYSFKSSGWPWLTQDDEDGGADIHSLDITQLSAHERIRIHGRQSPDLAQMLSGKSERYVVFDDPLHMSCCTMGIFVVDTAKSDPLQEGRYEPVCECVSEAQAKTVAEAMNLAEYAAKIMGGQSYQALPDVTYVSVSDEAGVMEDDVLELLGDKGGQG